MSLLYNFWHFVSVMGSRFNILDILGKNRKKKKKNEKYFIEYNNNGHLYWYIYIFLKLLLSVKAIVYFITTKECRFKQMRYQHPPNRYLFLLFQCNLYYSYSAIRSFLIGILWSNLYFCSFLEIFIYTEYVFLVISDLPYSYLKLLPDCRLFIS